MPGSIDYSLGLATRGFLGPLGLAQGALAAFTGFAVGSAGLLAGVFAQIERGGQLADLKSRTGENVDTLFKLQEGFKIVGLEAGKVSPVILALQKAMSGVSESGESTADAFAAAGLSFSKLRSLDAVGQLAAVTEQLGKLSKSDAAGIAGKIFGRGISGDILQIGRDFKSFEDTLQRVDGQARTFKRNADAFDQLGDTLQALKTTGAGFFTEIAAGVTPALQGVLNSLQGFDVEGLGRRIGNAFRALTAAFERGQVTELVGLSLAAGFEKAIDVLQRGLVAVFAYLPSLIGGATGRAIGLTLVAGIGKPFADFFAAMADSPILGITPDSPVGRSLRAQAAGFRLLGGAAQEGVAEAFTEGATDYFKAVRDGFKGFGSAPAGPNQQRLSDLITALVPPFADTTLAKTAVNPSGVLLGGGKKGSEGAADALTRIGFFSGGAGGSESQSARETAKATRESAKLLYRINERMERGFGTNFANV